MIENLKKCSFKYTFRDYQKRVLDEARKHLSDGKLNVIAAPGAGKTILALSLMIEIGKPALIVAPTILLRQQWLDRLEKDFYNFEGIKDIISEDIYNPNFITITTYQALYSVYKGRSQKSKNFNLINELKKFGIATIILDEAHHLKMSWLDATKSVIDKLKDTITISLTATPPYDIDTFLWNKYINLCGEADAEISVPELVKTKDLAPHQDFIYFNYPSNAEMSEMDEYTNKIQEIFLKYSTSSEVVMAISMHEGIIDLESKLEYFIQNFEYYDAMISFLRFNNIDIPENKYFKYDYKESKFDINKLQILLTYVLYNDRKSYVKFEGLLKDIARDLNKIGAIYERKINLFYSNEIRKSITQNTGKIDSVKEILEFEYKELGEKLKSVIITENIYKELLCENDDYEFKYIGVIPLFRYLLKNTTLKYIVLTGEIILIPNQYKDIFIEISKKYGVTSSDIEMNDLSFNFDYSQINFLGTASKNRVLIITELFEQASINVLIGSNALIGEGWDAPFINTLIMATPVSAYVSANQIRGRVIRKYKLDPLKVSNIWHLVCVERDASGFIYGYDYENLLKRFEAFEGVTFKGDNISYGIERLDLSVNSRRHTGNLDLLNENFFAHASNREEISKKWVNSLKNYKPIRKNIIREDNTLEELADDQIIDIRFCLSLKYKYKTKKRKKSKNKTEGIIGLIRKRIQVLFDSLMNIGPEEKKNRIIKKIIQAIYNTLIYIQVIDASCELIIKENNEKLEYYLDNSSLKDNELLKKSVNEFLSKLDDARYAIKIDEFYFAVPSVIGKLNGHVKYFVKELGGNAEIIYLKSPEGKREMFNIKLLQSKLISNITKNDIIEAEENNSISDDIRNMKIMDNEFEKNI